jgi:hypothetical protein
LAAAVNDGEDFQSFIQPGPFTPERATSPNRQSPARGFHDVPHPREPDPSYSTPADSSAKGSHSPDLEIESPRSSTDGKAKYVPGPLPADEQPPRPSIFPFDNYPGLSFPPVQVPLRHQTGSSSSSE